MMHNSARTRSGVKYTETELREGKRKVENITE